MRGIGRWGVRPVLPQALLLALHLRDAAGLRPPPSPLLPDLPPLDPPVRRLTAGGAPLTGTEQAGAQWATWWERSFPGGPEALTSLLPPTFPGLRGAPELRGLVELGIDEAVTWARRARERHERVLAATPTALFETTLLAQVERELGRPVRCFQLDVVVLPVRGAGAWETPAGPVLSLELRGDRDAYLDWLRQQLLRAGRGGGRPSGPHAPRGTSADGAR